MLTETEPFVDTPEDVFHEVENKASMMGINIKQKTWPKSPQAFTRKLNEAKDAIASLGVHYDVVPKGITREFQVWITDDPLEGISKNKAENKPIIETAGNGAVSKYINAFPIKRQPGVYCSALDHDDGCHYEAEWNLNGNLYCKTHFPEQAKFCEDNGVGVKIMNPSEVS